MSISEHLFYGCFLQIFGGKKFIKIRGNRDKGLAVNSCYVLPWHPINIFLVVSMIWFSYTDILYIKMMGYPWEKDWNLHRQYFFIIERKQWKWHDIFLFQLFGPVLFSTHVYGSFAASMIEMKVWIVKCKRERGFIL